MQIKIDFRYGIRYVPYRHSNTRIAPGVASTVVDVRNVPGDQAPVVLEVGNPVDEGVRPSRYGLKQDGTARRVRRFEGKLFVEAQPAAVFERMIEENLKKTFFGRSKAISDPAQENQPAMTGQQVLARYSSPGAPMRTFEDDKGARVARALSRLADLMIEVDGVVYEYTPEPILKIDPSRGGAVISPRPLVPGTGHDTYHFHDYEQMAVRSSLKHAHSVAQYANGTLPFFRVLDPSALTFDGATYDVTEQAKKLFRHLSSHADGLPWDVLEAFYDFRDAYEDAAERVTPRLVAAMEAITQLEDTSDRKAVSAIAAQTEAAAKGDLSDQRSRANIYRSRDRFLSSEGIERARQMAEFALERWSLRPSDAHWEDRLPILSSMKTPDRRVVVEVASEGQAADLASRSGFDLHEALNAVSRGERLLALRSQTTEFSKSPSPAVALLNPDGELTLLSEGEEKDALEMFLAYRRATDRLREEDELALALPTYGGVQ